MSRSESLKGMVIRPLEEFVDDVMLSVPHASIDMADDAFRAKFRSWLLRMAQAITRQNADAFADASERAMKECAALLNDPLLYANRKKRQDERRERLLAKRAMQPPIAPVPAPLAARPPALAFRPVAKKRK